VPLVHQEAEAVANAVIDAALEVHRVLGPGFLPAAYEGALCHELGLRGIAYERQALIRVRYKDLPVGEGRLDLVVENLVLVELRALPSVGLLHLAQMTSYLKATGRPVGLLLNFGNVTMKSGVRKVILSAAMSQAERQRSA
jgi:GxxExxY protein